jgi:thiamine-phosphate pyrophosphorylase
VLFIVNDRVDLAIAAGAAGVHLGQDDDWASARERLGPGPVLGLSVETVEQAEAAAEAGADYLGVTVWPTETKPEATPHGLERVAEIAAAVDVPLVGIGGITAVNARQVLDAGAAGVAVISAVGAAPDPAEATRALVRAVRGTAGTPPRAVGR